MEFLLAGMTMREARGRVNFGDFDLVEFEPDQKGDTWTGCFVGRRYNMDTKRFVIDSIDNVSGCVVIGEEDEVVD